MVASVARAVNCWFNAARLVWAAAYCSCKLACSRCEVSARFSCSVNCACCCAAVSRVFCSSLCSCSRFCCSSFNAVRMTFARSPPLVGAFVTATGAGAASSLPPLTLLMSGEENTSRLTSKKSQMTIRMLRFMTRKGRVRRPVQRCSRLRQWIRLQLPIRTSGARVAGGRS